MFFLLFSGGVFEFVIIWLWVWFLFRVCEIFIYLLIYFYDLFIGLYIVFSFIYEMLDFDNFIFNSIIGYRD